MRYIGIWNRYEERLKKIKPLIDEFFSWIEKLPASGKSKLAGAISYALNERESVCSRQKKLAVQQHSERSRLQCGTVFHRIDGTGKRT